MLHADLQLSVMSGGLCRPLAKRIGNWMAIAPASALFRNFNGASATVADSNQIVRVRFGHRAVNPMINCSLAYETVLQRLENRSLKLEVGE